MNRESEERLAAELASIIGTIQFQVLNNLDAVVRGTGVNLERLNDMVKRPLMVMAVTPLKHMQQTILRELSGQNRIPGMKPEVQGKE